MYRQSNFNFWQNEPKFPEASSAHAFQVRPRRSITQSFFVYQCDGNEPRVTRRCRFLRRSQDGFHLDQKNFPQHGTAPWSEAYLLVLLLVLRRRCSIRCSSQRQLRAGSRRPSFSCSCGSMEHKGIVDKLHSRQFLCVHHELERFDRLTNRRTCDTCVGGSSGRPYSETSCDQSCGNRTQAALAHQSPPIQSAAISGRLTGTDMPDSGLGRCDGHHEMVDFRLRKWPRMGLGPSGASLACGPNIVSSDQKNGFNCVSCGILQASRVAFAEREHRPRGRWMRHPL